MKKSITLLLALLFLNTLSIQAQAPSIAWQKCIGGTALDYATSIIETDDGNYLVCGVAASNTGDMLNTVSLTSKGLADYWVYKVSPAGGIIWRQVFGGSANELAPVCIALGNDKYVMAGTTHTQNDNDISGSFGCFGSCLDCDDVWVVCFDGSGSKLWSTTLGTDNFEHFRDIIKTRDNKIAVLYYGYSKNCVPQSTAVPSDAIVIQMLDTNGVAASQPTVGIGDADSSADQPSAICQNLVSNSMAIAGATVTGLFDQIKSKGGFDFWLIGITASGTGVNFQRSMGGSGLDAATSIAATHDGGYIMTGLTKSNDKDVHGSHGASKGDIWVVKTNATGTIQWSKCYGGSEIDYGLRITQQPDHSYLLVAVTASNDGDITGNHSTLGRTDYWIAELGDSGQINWSKTLGGTGIESIMDIHAGIDPTISSEFYSPRTGLLLDSQGDIVLAGGTASNDGDVSSLHGNVDYWLVKLSQTVSGLREPVSILPVLHLYPNPAQNQLTIACQGAKDDIFAIYDMQGRVVRGGIRLGSGIANIDIADFDAGFYCIRASNNPSLIRSFIKQ
jgi:Secretion system C-terminal sorting domain